MADKDTYVIQIKLISDSLADTYARLLDYNEKNEQKAKSFLDAIANFKLLIDNAQNFETFSGDFYDRYISSGKEFQDNVIGFVKKIDAKRDKALVTQIKGSIDIIKKNIDALRFVSKTALVFKSLDERIKSGKEIQEINSQLPSFDPDGVMPTVSQCQSLNVNDSNTKDFFGSFLWLYTYSKQKSHEQPHEKDYFERTYDRLKKELLLAEPDRQAAFAVMLARYDASAKMLNSDKFGAFKKEFEGTRIFNAVNTASSMINSAIDLNAPKAENIKPQGKGFLESIKNGNITVITSIASTFEKLIKDERRSSSSFNALKAAAASLAAIDFTKPMSFEENMRIFSKARDAAQLYLNLHKKSPASDKGKERVANARALISVIDEHLASVSQKQNTTDTAEIADLQKTGSIENFRKIAKLQRHIAPVRMIPKASGFTFEPTKWEKFKGAAKHYLFNAVFTVLGNTLGQIVNAVSYPFNKGKKTAPVETELDHEFIPGRNGEKFEPIVLGDDPNQPILSDTRRTPLVWEKPIPEDPNQPPTVSFEFNQGREGDATANAWTKNDKGEWELSTGHGLITLNYTKKNPISGKPERYKLRIGFHPRGGFGTGNINSDMVLSGTTIPGQLMENSNYIFTTGKTVTVNNAQINKILLASLEYEKGGYNMITRNCTTFVKDMADAAGIDVSGILKEVDFNTESVSEKFGLVGLAVGGGPLASRLANRDILSKSGKTDLSYQRFGQKMLNKEDVKRLDKKAYNQRMKGYSPSHAGEAIRHSEDFKFHARNYMGAGVRNKNNWRSPIAKEMDLLEAFETEIMILRAAVVKNALDNGFTESDISSQLDALDNYGKTVFDAITKNEGKAFNSEIIVTPEGQQLGVETSKEDQKKALVDGKVMLTEFQDGYTEIFKNVFKSDPGLSIPFSHITSILTYIKESYDEEYNDLRFNGLRFDPAEGINLEQDKIMDSMADPEREIGFALKHFENGMYEFFSNENPDDPSYRCKAFNAVGMIMAHGSIKKGIELRREKDAIYAKLGVMEKPSDKDQRRIDAIDRLLTLDKNFSLSQNSFFSGRRLTENDYRLAFVEIPKGLEGFTNINPKSKNPAGIRQEDVYTLDKCYQAACFEQMFKGIKKELQSVGQSEQFENPEQFTARMANLLSEKLNQRPKELDKLKKVLAEKYSAEEPFKPGKETTQEYAIRINRKINNVVVESLTKSFFNPLLKETGRKLIVNNPGQIKVADLFIKGIEGKNLLESESFLKSVNKSADLPEEASLEEKAHII